MITLITGQPGKGKSALCAAWGIASALDPGKRSDMLSACKNLRRQGFSLPKDNYVLYSDFKIRYKYLGEKVFESIDVDPCNIAGKDEKKRIYLRPYTTLCISEAQAYFNSHAWQKFTPEQAKFFQTARHFGLDIFMDTQNYENVEGTVRKICRIIEVKERYIYDSSGRKCSWAKEFNFSKMTWHYLEYQNAKDYELQRNGEKKQYTIYYNIYECYNPYERFNDYLPLDKSVVFK